MKTGKKRIPGAAARQTVIAAVFFCILSGLLPAGTACAGVDNSIYAALLQRHVKGRRVSYDGLKKDEALLDRYLAILSATDPDTLPRNPKLAFYINAYNAFTLKLILTRYPDINSIKEIGSFFSNPWSKKFILLNGRTVSLDYIEQEVLRDRFKDPRIHFAINCASRSCPALFNKPFEGEKLDHQLEARTRAFINDTKSNYLKGNTLYLSKIFSWFKADFNDNPLYFVRLYADPNLRKALDAVPAVKVSYLPYDWTLNRR